MFASKDFLLTAGGAGGPTHPINNSLRFRSSASADLSRTPSVAGNRQTWTWSGWLKRGSFGDGFIMGTNYASVGGLHSIRWSADNLSMYIEPATGVKTGWTTTAVFRDPSAWYHVVFAFDTTQASVADMCKIYVNGVLQTITIFNYNASYISQNANGLINGTTLHTIGSGRTVYTYYFDGYMAEVNFVNGQALTPSSFGAYDAVTGVWQPARYTGTYGTNGYYLKFASTGSTAALGTDSSGNSNTWTVNNFSVTAGTTYDPMIDSPTVGSLASNYGVLNPLAWGGSTYYTPIDGNLAWREASGIASWKSRFATIAPSSGKWYAEFYWTYSGTNPLSSLAFVGLHNGLQSTTYCGQTANTYGYSASGVKYNNATSAAYGSSWGNGSLVQIAYDADNGKVWFGLNGSWQASGDPAAGTNPAYTGVPANLFIGISAYWVSPDGTTWAYANFGQRPFTYTPPSGFVALNSYNLPAPTIANGASYMAATTYTGTGATQSISDGANTTTNVTFQPDLVWIKSRSAATNNNVFDSLRTATNYLISNSTAANATNANTLTAFNAGGFALGTDASSIGVNISTNTYVAWQWLAGAGSSSTNTNGSITSTVSVNATAGFSVVTYTGTGANATVGHGLGVAPSMVIVKNRISTTQNWNVWFAGFAGTDYILLNTTAATGSSATLWNSTAPSSTVFSVGTANGANGSTNGMVAYCWSAVAGYSAFGSYTGNGSADGPFIYTGFRPRFILTKCSSLGGSGFEWFLYDTSRSTYNTASALLQPQSSAAEQTAAVFDIVSNGFKIRDAGNAINSVSQTYIYAAFAENPFKYALAR